MTAGIEKPALYCRLELAGLFWALSSWAAGLWGLIVKTFQKRDTGIWSAFSPFRPPAPTPYLQKNIEVELWKIRSLLTDGI